METTRKLSVAEQKDLIPDDSIYETFCRRGDVKAMTAEERAAAWERTLEGINRLREMLADVPNYVVKS